MGSFLEHQIDKKQITAMTIFVRNNVPGVDPFSLNKFLELMNTTGSFGSITGNQLKQILKLMAKHIPNVCHHSLQVLAEHLALYLPPNGEDNDDFFTIPSDEPDAVDSKNKKSQAITYRNGRERKRSRE